MRQHRRALGKSFVALVAVAGLWATSAAAQLLPHKELFDAIEANNITELRRIVLGGMSVNQVNDEGKPALVVAASLNRYYLIDFMTDHGVNLNATTKQQRETPAMVAASTGSFEALEMLIEAGADLDAEDKRGETALMKAVLAGNFRIVRSLVDAGVDLNHTDYTGRTALVYAEENRERGIQRFLEGQGATY